MKICFVSHGSSSYGAERSLAEVVAHALVAGHDVEVHLPEPGPIEEILSQRGVPATAIRYATNRRWAGSDVRGLGTPGQIARVLLDVVRFSRTFRARTPDVVVVNTAVAPAAMVAGRLTGRPVVTLVRESLCTSTSLGSPVPCRIALALIRAMSTVVVSNSAVTAREVGGSATVVYPPVASCRIDPGPARERDGALRLVALGRFTEEKGQLDLVSASIRALKAGHCVEVDLYGDDTIEPAYALSMRELIARSQLGHAIRMHPFVRDVVPVLRGADASVVTSNGEAFGRVTVESLQCNVPVIGYDRAGTSEILRNGGGALLEPTSEALEAEIIRMCSDSNHLVQLKRDAARVGERWRAIRPESELVSIIERAGGA